MLHLYSSELKELQRFYWLNWCLMLARDQQSIFQRWPRCWLGRWCTGHWRTMWRHTPAEHCFHSEHLGEISWSQPVVLQLQILGEKEKKHSCIFAGLIRKLFLFPIKHTWDAYGLLSGWEAAMKSFTLKKLQLFPLTEGDLQTAY